MVNRTESEDLRLPTDCPDYVIVDPEAASKQVFVEMLVVQRDFWIKVDKADLAESFAMRFRNLAKTQGKDLGSTTATSGSSTATESQKVQVSSAT